jgi:putative ABC transport system permease protein
MKEIGIKKVIGANLRTIFISGIISIPLLYNVSIKWLNQYAYHLNVDVFLFLIPVFIILIIAVLSFSIPILKALLIDKKL